MAPDYTYRCVHCGYHYTAVQKMCPHCLCRTLTRRVVQDGHQTGIEIPRPVTHRVLKFTIPV